MTQTGTWKYAGVYIYVCTFDVLVWVVDRWACLISWHLSLLHNAAQQHIKNYSHIQNHKITVIE